jgi:DNA-binding CsgD family transcriptional regulator
VADTWTRAVTDRPPRLDKTIKTGRETLILPGVILFQCVCTVFFLIDVVSDLAQSDWSMPADLHMLPEIGATLGLISGIVVLTAYLLRLLRRQAHLERSLGVAQGALAELIEEYFTTWGLTPSEADVATFTIKGYSIAEIAELRGSAEATVKTHLNAIYRKAGVTGRGQLVSLLIEDLMRGTLTANASGPDIPSAASASLRD